MTRSFCDSNRSSRKAHSGRRPSGVVYFDWCQIGFNVRLLTFASAVRSNVELAHDPMALTTRARRIEVTLGWALSSPICWIVTHITHQLCYNLIHGPYPGSPKSLVRGYWERARQHINPSAGRGKATAEQCLSVASYHSIRRMVALSHRAANRRRFVVPP
jgi:hypothetical protein